MHDLNNFSPRWTLEAMSQLNSKLPGCIVVNVLRQAAKSCVVKRDFKKAGVLIKQAVYLAREVFNSDHPKYSDVLIDYGFYLMNSDNIISSVAVYEVRIKGIFFPINQDYFAYTQKYCVENF